MNQKQQATVVGIIGGAMSAGIPLSTIMRGIAASRVQAEAMQRSPEDLARIEAARLKMERKAARKAAQC